MRSARRLWAGLILVSAIAASGLGCGGGPVKTYPVTGTVKITGAGELKTGEIVFTSEKVTAKSQINSDGTFTLSTYGTRDGAPAGKYQVYILGASVNKPTSANPYGIELLIDPKFGDRKTSGLEFTVEEKSNKFTVEVTPPGPNAGKPGQPAKPRSRT